LITSRNSFALSTFPFHRYNDSAGAKIALTHAASRLFTTALAIFLPSAKLAHVTSTTRALVFRAIDLVHSLFAR